MKQRDDLVIKRVREARHHISEKLDHDPKKVIEYYMELQKKYLDRMLPSIEIEETAVSTLQTA
ncbi:MAG: hypothetical protein JW934_22930 [Anaerolineae bacterium]|nr:hypothetical protein [Anaerolineae bacterium]